MNSGRRIRLNVEILEDRLTPALTIATDALGNLSISGTPDSLAGTQSQPIVVTETAQNFYTVSENGVQVGGPNAVFFAPGGVNVNFSQSALDDSVTVSLGGFSINGNLSINTGGGADSVSVQGGGSIGGSVTLTGDTGIVGINNTLDTVTVGGSVTINSAQKSLPFTIFAVNTAIGGNLSISEGNGSATI